MSLFQMVKHCWLLSNTNWEAGGLKFIKKGLKIQSRFCFLNELKTSSFAVIHSEVLILVCITVNVKSKHVISLSMYVCITLRVCILLSPVKSSNVLFSILTNILGAMESPTTQYQIDLLRKTQEFICYCHDSRSGIVLNNFSFCFQIGLARFVQGFVQS